MTDATRVSPFLGLPGAVEGEGPNAGAPAHYGALVAEQRPLERGGAVVDLGNLGVIRLRGADRLTWLDSLTSGLVRSLAPGESGETLLLDVQGRIEHAAAVLDDGESTWLVTEGTRADEFASWLDRMRFLLDVRVERADEIVAAVGVFGDRELGAAAPNGVPLVWHDEWASTRVGGVSYATTDAHPGRDWDLHVHLLERPALEALAERVRVGDVSAAGIDALEALRIAAWRPRLARDVDSRAIPHELDWTRSAVHLEKGCYRGQETVAKVHNLGRPPRRLVHLDLDGSLGALPAAGAVLHVAGDPDRAVVGQITSIGVHHENGPIALALVKRRLDPEAVLAADLDGEGITAAQTAIVSPEAGHAADVPRLPRLGRRSG
ncbi:folate-binding protein YgfZ [Pseudoclavibacter chungangensis]|uniref:Folate-binding protein YgfZ n=1 Tax=Pseudoclavibacter chungangensis TaxID=587635 RepID=A0A7J5C0S2_9MICO|nr:folate-binding protein YgfZ [Pseudoclavibacter chungangensis]KAB1660336.1 folate-binding protein YgfZ [Pseudoclavibacter chungangensis]NYJ65693.1 hypothetical protein [Pseudoclavibacter chungangensis]